MSSSVWMNDHKKDFDPNAKIDQSVFEDADEEGVTAQPPLDRTSSVESSIRAPSNDSVLRLQSSDLRFPSVTSSASRAPSNDSCLQSLIAATAAYEEASRIASSDSLRFPSVDSVPRFPSADLWQRSVSSDGFQRLLSSLAAEKADQRLSSCSEYDMISQQILKNGRTPAPAVPSSVMETPLPAIKIPSKTPPGHGVPPPKQNKNLQNRVFVDEIRENDVLCGRGGKSNHHIGNKKYRQVVSEMKQGYRGISAKTAKTDLSRQIVDHVLEYGGRFLKRDASSGRYYILKHNEARKKTSQALRETKVLKWTVENSKQQQVSV